VYRVVCLRVMRCSSLVFDVLCDIIVISVARLTMFLWTHRVVYHVDLGGRQPRG
jgi:hypothetical protein